MNCQEKSIIKNHLMRDSLSLISARVLEPSTKLNPRRRFVCWHLVMDISFEIFRLIII